jgi:hypothetical protein
VSAPAPIRTGLSVVLTLGLAACASYGPDALSPGLGVDEITRQMGPPTDRHALPGDGVRLEYARGPAGLHTYMLDLGPEGRLRGWTQVLTPENFARIEPGWARRRVLRELGRPTQERRFERLDQRVWSYRFDSIDCTWLQVTFSLRTDRVTSAGAGPDPRCEADTLGQ